MNPYNGFTGLQRGRALDWLNRQYRDGLRQRPTACEVCGQTEGMFQAHSEDYSGPPYGDNIGAHGLCYVCHMMIHCRFASSAAWARYKLALAAGLMAWNPPRPMWGLITKYLNGHDFAWNTAPDSPRSNLLSLLR